MNDPRRGQRGQYLDPIEAEARAVEANLRIVLTGAQAAIYAGADKTDLLRSAAMLFIGYSVIDGLSLEAAQRLIAENWDVYQGELQRFEQQKKESSS